MRVEKFEKGPIQYHIRDLEDDMGEQTQMDLLVEEDGDVIVTLRGHNAALALSMQFCTRMGGGRYPVISAKLRELVKILAEEQG